VNPYTFQFLIGVPSVTFGTAAMTLGVLSFYGIAPFPIPL